MAQYETFQSNAGEFPIMRKWLLRALVISLLIHAGLLVFFSVKKLDNFGYSESERLAPPLVRVRQVVMPKAADEDVKLVLPDKKPVQPIAIPKDNPTVDEVQVKPFAPELTAPIVQEKPKVDLSSGFDALEKNQGNSMAMLEKQLGGVADSLMDKSTRSRNQPTITIPTGKRGGDGGSDSGGIPGRVSIEQALDKATGPIGNKAVAMRGGALFEWGKADLRGEAIEDLRKLGELIKRNPNATFIISGHTDHTGSHDTNLILSQQRADAVRDWLVANLGMDPMRITTIGKADDEAFPNLGADKSIDEQAPNRRVEIVIRTHRK
jgi:outer membrane protein OmpA-like peptidoglycan-associated protein